MKKTAKIEWPCLIIAVMACASSAAAQTPDPSPEELARYGAVSKEAESNAELIFSTLPTIADQKTRNSVLRYNLAARAWLVELRCKFAGAEQKKQFETDMGIFTNTMDMILGAEFKKPPREANEYTQRIQMHALNAMSANKFFDCSDKAKDIWVVGITETAAVGDFARTLTQRLREQPKE